MHVVERGGRQNLVLSATDLANFLGCRHRTALDIAVAYGRRDRAFVDDPLLEALRKRGLDHEKRYVDLLRAGGGVVVDLASITDPDEQIKETREAMAKGVDVIVQGALADGPWLAGRDYSLADVDMAPFVHRIAALGEARMIDARPRAADWYARMRARPAFRAAMEWRP